MRQMVMDLLVTSGVMATLLEQAAAAAPQECCGLLLCDAIPDACEEGPVEDGVLRIDRAQPARNVAADPLTTFEIDPAALLRAHKAAREAALRQRGVRLVGYYQSHPNGRAAPSPRDQEMASGDGRVWAIIANAEVTFWQDAPSGFEPLSYGVEDG